MSGKHNLALAVVAMQKGEKDNALAYLSKACEYQDDLTQFVSEFSPLAPEAALNGTVSDSDNTIAPSLATASSDGFLSLSARVSRHMALASSLDDGDELDAEQSEEFLAESSEDEDDQEVESTSSAVGPVRYKS